jgi:hypothetical protein
MAYFPLKLDFATGYLLVRLDDLASPNRSGRAASARPDRPVGSLLADAVG